MVCLMAFKRPFLNLKVPYMFVDKLKLELYSLKLLKPLIVSDTTVPKDPSVFCIEGS